MNNTKLGGGSWTCEKCKKTIQGTSIYHECVSALDDIETLKKLTYKAVDELYECYEVKHSFTMCLYLRFNGDAEDPGELLSKEEFTTLIWKGGEWSTAYDALFQYIVKQFKLKN